MANIIKLGSILLDGTHTKPGSEYQPGQSICFADGDTLSWIVVNGLLIADRPLLVNISWDDLNSHDLVFGKQVIINGQHFLCRLLQVGEKEGVPNEWDAALDVVGDDNDLWHWNETVFWGQENVYGAYYTLRGFTTPRFYRWHPAFHKNEFYGFRPALEPIASESLKTGARICGIGGQSVLYGTLLEVTNYDVLVQPEQTSMMANVDTDNLYTKLQNGTIILNRHLMTVQIIEEE